MSKDKLDKPEGIIITGGNHEIKAIGSEKLFTGLPCWSRLLEVIKDYQRNGYLVTYWASNETVSEFEQLGVVPLDVTTTESAVVITLDNGGMSHKIPKLSCHHIHHITLLPEFNIKYIEQ